MHSLSARQTTDPVVAFLSDPANYPGPPASVEIIETHHSWIFLTASNAYKLKKPVRTPFMDFTSVEKRRLNCATEVSLNQRLAAGVYLGIVPLVADAAGHLHIGGDGETIDWLVHMQRLPAELMLDQLIRKQQVDLLQVQKAADMLAEFYLAATPQPMTGRAYRQRLETEILNNGQELGKPAYGLPQATLEKVSAAQHRFLATNAALLDERAGQVVEAHGDLRPEHICLLDTPVVIDCLEFKRQLRLLDPVDELAYLAMECDMLDATAIGRLFLAVYQKRTGETPPPALIAFYQSFRACLRAKLSALHLQEDPQQRRRHWLRLATRFLQQAEQYTQTFSTGASR